MQSTRQWSFASALARVAYFAAAALAGLAFPALARQGAAPPPAAALKVQLNWRHQFEFAAFYAAIEKGFYREAGLRVELLEGGPGIDVVDEVVNNRAQFGVANSSLILARAKGQPVVALAALMQHSAFALLARRDRGIESVYDLDGKVVSCAAHACDEIRAYLAASGLTGNRVRYVPLRSAKVEENFSHSDATDVFVSNQGFQILGQEDKYVLLMPRSAGIDLYGDILFTVEAQVDRFSERAADFRTATIRGLQYAMSHPEELIDLILAKYNSQGKSREHLAFEASKLASLTRLDLVEPGYMSLGRWRHVRDVYAGLDMLPPGYSVESLIYKPELDPWPDWVVWAMVMLVLAAAGSALVALHLRRVNFRLHREVSQRAKAEVALMAGQAQFRRFVDQANTLVAHELRTPLSVLQAHVGILELKLGETRACDNNLVAMKTAISRLKALFDRNLAQVFASTKFRSVDQLLDLGEAVEVIVAGQRVLAPDSDIRYERPEASLAARISRDMFDTVLANLIENAQKFSVPGSPVEICAGAEGAFIEIVVSSLPALAPPADVETLFAERARGHAPDSIEGTGIGLHLVRMIAEMHGGSARIEIGPTLPAEGAGRFIVYVRLPRTEAPVRLPSAEGT